jgi:tellurite resistance protein TerC
MRITMILIGAELIERFHWINYIFGAFLVYTGLKMLREDEGEIEPEHNPIVKLVTRYVPIVRHYDGQKFFTVISGRRVGTLLFLVLIIVEVTDLIFAVDSIPAIFAVTTNRFILYTSNVFAILGLRSLYFLLAGVVEKFHYLRIGLAGVLSFIGSKMLLVMIGIKVRTPLALGVVALMLGGAVIASIIWPAPTFESSTEVLPDFDAGQDKRENS